jgi:hypothetical protein
LKENTKTAYVRELFFATNIQTKQKRKYSEYYLNSILYAKRLNEEFMEDIHHKNCVL